MISQLIERETIEERHLCNVYMHNLSNSPFFLARHRVILFKFLEQWYLHPLRLDAYFLVENTLASHGGCDPPLKQIIYFPFKIRKIS